MKKIRLAALLALIPLVALSAIVPITVSIMEEVVGTRAYVVLDRAYIEQGLKEQEFDVSSVVSDTQVAKAGQYVGADYVVTGKVQLLDDSFVLVAKMIEVRTGSIVSQSSTQGAGKLTALLEMAHSIGKKFVAGGPISPLGPTVDGTTKRPAASSTPSPRRPRRASGRSRSRAIHRTS